MPCFSNRSKLGRGPRCRQAFGLALALGSTACSTTLQRTSHLYSDAAMPYLERAGTTLGCHARESHLFALFLICPGRDQALGIAESEGKLSLSCPKLRPRLCRQLFARLEAAVVASNAPQPTAGEPPSAADLER